MFVIVLSLLLVSTSLAKYESLTIGPYRISYNLESTQPHSISNATKHSETYCGEKYHAYTTMLSSNGNFAFITIADFEEDNMSKSPFSTKSEIEDFLQGFSYYNIRFYNRTVDNQEGVLGVGVNHNGDLMYAAQYWMKSDATCINASTCTNVLIESNYPWDNGTLSLLKTIRVEPICKIINNSY